MLGPRHFLPRRVRRGRAVERQLLGLLLEHSGTPIVAFDRAGAVTHATKGARALLGEAGADGASPQLWIDLLEPRAPWGLPLSASDLPHVRAVQGGPPTSFDLVIETDAGSRTVRALVHPIEGASGAAEPTVVVQFQFVHTSARSA